DSGDEARERLEARLTALLRENKRLKADLAAAGAGKSGPGDAPNGSASLREEMHGLAAEVVHLAMKLDGPDSPIARALNAPSGTQGAGRMMSLADRVRALQKHGQGCQRPRRSMNARALPGQGRLEEVMQRDRRGCSHIQAVEAPHHADAQG